MFDDFAEILLVVAEGADGPLALGGELTALLAGWLALAVDDVIVIVIVNSNSNSNSNSKGSTIMGRAAAKVMDFDRLGKTSTPWHFCEDNIKVGQREVPL